LAPQQPPVLAGAAAGAVAGVPPQQLPPVLPWEGSW